MDSMRNVPPVERMMPRTALSPRPRPELFVEKNGSNMRLRTSSESPLPVSSTEMRTHAPACSGVRSCSDGGGASTRAASNVTRPAESPIASAAFVSKFNATTRADYNENKARFGQDEKPRRWGSYMGASQQAGSLGRDVVSGQHGVSGTAGAGTAMKIGAQLSDADLDAFKLKLGQIVKAREDEIGIAGLASYGGHEVLGVPGAAARADVLVAFERITVAQHLGVRLLDEQRPDLFLFP